MGSVMISDRADALVEAAHALAPQIIAVRDRIDRDRCLPEALIGDLRATGLLRLHTPRALGGHELDVAGYMRVIEALAQSDGATAWTVTAINNGFHLGLLPNETVAAVYGANPDAAIAGSFPPKHGRALVVDGGYLLSGRWTYVSGCMHSDWLYLGAMLLDGDAPVEDAQGAPQTRRLLIRRADAEIVDTWHVSGLRGTGSHDVAVTDVFVPEAYSRSIPSTPRSWPGALWTFPETSFLGLGFCSVALGLARAAIDALTDLAGAKTPYRSASLLRERVTAQIEVARAEAMLRSARLFLFEMVEQVRVAALDGAVALRQRAMLRAAVVHAATTAAQVVDLMVAAGGATSIHESSPLERCFRDVHAVTPQVMVAPPYWETVGRVLLGLDPGPAPL